MPAPTEKEESSWDSISRQSKSELPEEEPSPDKYKNAYRPMLKHLQGEQVFYEVKHEQKSSAKWQQQVALMAQDQIDSCLLNAERFIKIKQELFEKQYLQGKQS
jgi:hypothetical protein